MARPLVRFGMAAVVALAAGTGSVAAAAAAPVLSPAGMSASSVHDYNDDGYGDLAIGIPYARVNGHARAGAVEVIFGSASGLRASGNERWTLDSPGVPGQAAANDKFGYAVASADFDQDGYDDLAVGAPGWTLHNGGVAYHDSGNVYVLFGSAGGLTTHAGYVPGFQDRGAEHGYALAITDMLDSNGFPAGGDGYPDLVIGGPGTSTVSIRSGLDISNLPTSYHQYELTYGDDRRLGASLASGTFTNQGPAIAIGAPDTDVSVEGQQAGAVWILDKRLTSGLTILFQNSFGGNPSEENDHFGAAVAAADLDANGYDDLVIGVPGEDSTDNQGGHATDTGAAQIMFTNNAGGDFSTSGWVLHQGFAGVPGENQTGDHFGASIALGALDGNASIDFAIGVPGKTVAGKAGAGTVDVLFNDGTGLPNSSGNQRWTQDSSGVLDAAESGDHFGGSLSLGQLGRSDGLDLAIGVPGEDVNSRANAGGVNVLYHGPAAGFAALNNQFWTADSPGIAGSTQAGDSFGLSVR